MPGRLVIEKLPPEGFFLVPRVKERGTKYDPHLVFARKVDGELHTAIVLLRRLPGHPDFSLSRNCLAYFSQLIGRSIHQVYFVFHDAGSNLVLNTMTCAEIFDLTLAAKWRLSPVGIEYCWVTEKGAPVDPIGESPPPWERGGRFSPSRP
jgi:hypothetical protein